MAMDHFRCVGIISKMSQTMHEEISIHTSCVRCQHLRWGFGASKYNSSEILLRGKIMAGIY